MLFIVYPKEYMYSTCSPHQAQGRQALLLCKPADLIRYNSAQHNKVAGLPSQWYVQHQRHMRHAGDGKRTPRRMAVALNQTLSAVHKHIKARGSARQMG